jgi:hypothetical protein
MRDKKKRKEYMKKWEEKHGHWRNTEKGKAYTKEYNRKYRENHKEELKVYSHQRWIDKKSKIQEYKKQWREKNKDRLKKEAQRKYIENKEEMDAKSRKYYYEHKEKCNKLSKIYREKHKEEMEHYKREWHRAFRKRLLKLIGETCCICNKVSYRMTFHEIHGKSHPLKNQYYRDNYKDFVTMCHRCHTLFHIFVKHKDKFLELETLLDK